MTALIAGVLKFSAVMMTGRIASPGKRLFGWLPVKLPLVFWRIVLPGVMMAKFRTPSPVAK